MRRVALGGVFNAAEDCAQAHGDEDERGVRLAEPLHFGLDDGEGFERAVDDAVDKGDIYCD